MPTLQQPLSAQEQDVRYLPLIPEIEPIIAAGHANIFQMPYHGWPDHPHSVRDANVAIREAQLEAGIKNVPSLFVTIMDSLIHDYLLYEYQQMLLAGKRPPAPSAEEYGAVQGGIVVARFGVDKYTVAELEDNVMGTKRGVLCNTPGKTNLCFADLAGVWSDYETEMKPDTERLRIETKAVDPLKFAVGSLHILSQYYFENLRMSRFIAQSPDLREKHALMGENLRTMTAELAEQTEAESADAFAREQAGFPARLYRPSSLVA